MNAVERMNISEILLRRKDKLTIEPMNTRLDSDHETQVEISRYILAIGGNVEAYGYTFGDDVIKTIMTYTRPALIEFHRKLIPMLMALRGADVLYTPMYPGFPEQVAEASDAELFVNAILHYWTFGQWRPEYRVGKRLPLLNAEKKTVLTIGTEDDLAEVFVNLCASKTSLSKQDLADIKAIIASKPAFVERLPETIPMKENAAYISNLLMQADPSGNYEAISRYMKTATDVLRLIVAMSDGDLSLASPTHFKHMRRPERRLIMGLLSRLGKVDEDMFRYRDEWIRIGEILHPGKFTNAMYKDIIKCFDMLRNEKKPLYFGGKVETLLEQGDVVAASELLKSRPGEFARRLDKLIRAAKTPADVNRVLNKFASVAEKVSTPVLLQVRQAFIERSEKKRDTRVFFPKGNVARAIIVPNELPDIDEIACLTVCNVCNRTLKDIYAGRKHMGNVYIDEAMKDYIVPFSQRSASSGNKTLVRGSKVPLGGNANVVRGFIWWTNTKNSRVDIDLAASILDEDFNFLGEVAYYHLKEAKFGGYHSGDIVDGGPENGDGVAEFVDVNIDSVVKNGGRYIAYQVYAFTRYPFCNLPNCRFGWMERSDLNDGEIFEPSTVETAIKLQANDTTSVPVLFDCVERRFIWMDMNLDIYGARYYACPNNAATNFNRVKSICEAFADIAKPNMYSLIALNAEARGKIVSDMGKADIIFKPDKSPVFRENPGEEEATEIPVITPYDVDYFMGELL